MTTQSLLKSSFLIVLGLLPAQGADYSAATSGNWDGADVWTPAGIPLTGSTDNVTIGTGRNILWNAINVGLAASGDLGTSGGHIITIDGGTLAQVPVGNWVRIGQGDTGGFNIKDGAFYFTSSTGTTGNAPALQVGIGGGTGTVNVGDGVGTFNTALLDLRHIADGVTDNAVGADLNLGSSGLGNGGGVGHLTIDGDGALISDVRTAGGASDPKVRIGQSPTLLGQSTLLVQNGGLFTANGTVELAAQPPADTARSSGKLTLTGAGTFMDHNAGKLQVGLNGDGVMLVEKGAQYYKFNNPSNRLDVYVGDSAGGTGVLTVENGGTFRLGPGGDVGDTRIGYSGTGVLNINDGGTYLREAGNWDWIGQQASGNGTVNVRTGGVFRTTAGANVVMAETVGAVGRMNVEGGLVSLEAAGSGIIKVGQRGTATYRQTSGTTNAGAFIVGGIDGTGTVELVGGSMSLRAQTFLGGETGTTVGVGTGTFNQTGGDLVMGGSLVAGLAAGHTGTFTSTGGTIAHNGSDITCGENGTGFITIGSGVTFNDNSANGLFLVGRNNGSKGTVIINGTLTRTSITRSIRVGNGNADGVENSDATGILGGTGTINLSAPSAVVIGSKGTLTGGTADTTGTLTLNGDLTYVTSGTLRANFDATGNVDRINVNGTVNLTGAVLTGTWAGGTSPVGAASRYWLIVNDGSDAITGTLGNTTATTSNPNASQAPGAAGFVTIGTQEFGVYYSADQASGALTGGNDLLLVALGSSAPVTNDQILKAVLGTSATGGPNLPVATRQGDNLVLTYNRVEASTSSYTATVEYSTTLAEGSWTTATAGMTAVTGSGATRTVTVTIPTGSGAPRYFARLRITSNP